MLGDNNLSVPKEQNVLKHYFSDQKTAEPSVTGNDGSSRMFHSSSSAPSKLASHDMGICL
ncbi:hypothetical protein CGMCC3_g2995 [Colletotrichum fructicola]|nr:uncharacterized protein CGMCC3_g2995 [Colletotrichum fructicola]KAE9581075.1 hypothetical protein CGMCC3_g2995 [Colletotrichum fructicola]